MTFMRYKVIDIFFFTQVLNKRPLEGPATRQECSWQTHLWPLKGLCQYYALLGLTQATGSAGGFD